MIRPLLLYGGLAAQSLVIRQANAVFFVAA